MQGKWTTVVEANAQTSAQGVSLLSLVSLVSDLRLTVLPAGTDELWVGSPATVAAQLRILDDPLPGATVNGILIYPDGARDQIVLLDDGADGDAVANDGVYSYSFLPTSEGIYSATLAASGQHEGKSFSRHDVWTANVAASYRSFLPLISTD